MRARGNDGKSGEYRCTRYAIAYIDSRSSSHRVDSGKFLTSMENPAEIEKVHLDEGEDVIKDRSIEDSLPRYDSIYRSIVARRYTLLSRYRKLIRSRGGLRRRVEDRGFSRERVWRDRRCERKERNAKGTTGRPKATINAVMRRLVTINRRSHRWRRGDEARLGGVPRTETESHVARFAINRAYRDASRREQGLNDGTLRPTADSLSAKRAGERPLFASLIRDSTSLARGTLNNKSRR